MIRFCALAPVACVVLLASINEAPAEPPPTETFMYAASIGALSATMSIPAIA